MARIPSKTKPATKPKRKLVADAFSAQYKAPPKGLTASKSRGKYKIGSHGFKKKEQKYLGAMFKITVSGSTHESEHAIGYEPIARGLNERRGHGETARRLENAAPAYQEVATLHRKHIGTGTLEDRSDPRFKTLDLTSTEYRRYQRTLLEDRHVGDAIQLNQMGYAFDPNSPAKWKTPEGQAASESYNRMIVYSDKVDYFDAAKGIATSQFSYLEKGEAFVARKIVENKSHPDASQLASYRQEFEDLLIDRRMAQFKDEIDPLTDEPYSAYFDAVLRARAARKNSPRPQNDNGPSNDNASPAREPFTLNKGEENPVAVMKMPTDLTSLDNNNASPNTSGKRPLADADTGSGRPSLETPVKKTRPDAPGSLFALDPTTPSTSGTRTAEPFQF